MFSQINQENESWLEESAVSYIPHPLKKFIKGLYIDAKIIQPVFEEKFRYLQTSP